MNPGLLGAIGGLGQGMTMVGSNIVKQQDDEARDVRSLIQQESLLKYRDELDAAKTKRISGEITAEANRVAGDRATGLLGAARQAYADAGMADDPAVVQGLATAQAEQSVPTTRDRVQAAANLGHPSPDLQLLQLDKQDLRDKAQQDANIIANKRLDITAMRDEARNALADRKLDIDSKKVDAMIAGIGAWAKTAGAGKTQTTAMIQNYAELERRGYSKDKIEQILFVGKPQAESFEQTSKPDPLGGPALITTKQKGAGVAPEATTAGNPGLDLSKFNRK